jgi:hypothetical protein
MEHSALSIKCKTHDLYGVVYIGEYGDRDGFVCPICFIPLASPPIESFPLREQPKRFPCVRPSTR